MGVDLQRSYGFTSAAQLSTGRKIIHESRVNSKKLGEGSMIYMHLSMSPNTQKQKCSQGKPCEKIDGKKQ